jgi:ATP-dependent Clp protease ATP-binding subunit ClpA
MRIADYPNLSRSGRRLLEHAAEIARLEGRNYVFVEHVLKAILREEESALNEVLGSLGIDQSRLSSLIEERIGRLPEFNGDGVRISEEVIDTFKRALARARVRSRDSVEAVDILLVLPQDETGSFQDIFSELGASHTDVSEAVRAVVSMREGQADSLSASSPIGGRREIAEGSDMPSRAYKKGEMVRIKSGAYQSMTGRVRDFNSDKSVVEVTVNIFNQQKLIELSHTDVEKLEFAEE